MNKIVEVKKNAVLMDSVEKVAKNVDKRLAKIDFDNMVANEDTVQSLKKLRATLNNEFAEFETARKQVKKQIMIPYDKFEEVYKTRIKKAYDEATNKLGKSIEKVDEIRLSNIEKPIMEYFKEECDKITEIEKIPFEIIGLKIGISTSEKKAKEHIDEKLNILKNDLQAINNLQEDEEYKAEVKNEYIKHFNLSAALVEVQNRKKAVEVTLGKREYIKPYPPQEKVIQKTKTDEIVTVHAKFTGKKQDIKKVQEYALNLGLIVE